MQRHINAVSTPRVKETVHSLKVIVYMTKSSIISIEGAKFVKGVSAIRISEIYLYQL